MVDVLGYTNTRVEVVSYSLRDDHERIDVELETLLCLNHMAGWSLELDQRQLCCIHDKSPVIVSLDTRFPSSGPVQNHTPLSFLSSPPGHLRIRESTPIAAK